MGAPANPLDWLELGPGVEFDIIRMFRERWGNLAPGIGDDAAVLTIPRGERVVASTDAAVENVHFRRDWLLLEDIAYRAVSAALSDLAAMAAEPRGVLIALTFPRLRSGELNALADGIGAAVRDAETVVLGGNLCRGELLSITTSVLGSAFTPLARSTAAPGDRVYVTGSLGGPAAALRMLESGSRPPAELLARFARPRPRIREARWLASRGASAAIDISDGVLGDAMHLAVASNVEIEIDPDALPVMPGADKKDASGGEEYELLVTAPEPLSETVFAQDFGIPLTLIGRVRGANGKPGVVVTGDSKRVAAPRGHDHFSH